MIWRIFARLIPSGVSPSTPGVIAPRLELVSRGQLLVAGERCGQGQECAEQLGGALIAQGQPTVASQPGQRPLDDPAVPAEPLAGLHPATGNPRSNPPRSQPRPQMRIVIALVRVQLVRSPPPAAAR